jgi:hypothetical protein
VATDELAREKWLRVNRGRQGYRRFVLGFSPEKA